MYSIEMNFVVCLQQKCSFAEFTLDVWSLKRIQMFIKFRFCFKNQITSVTYVSNMPNFVMFSLMVFITKGSRQKKNGLFSDIDHITHNTHPPVTQ